MKNPSLKKPTTKKGTPSLPYQEPHLVASARGKLLEEAIGREVRRFREKLGITISELAKAADMSAGMLSKIENGATSRMMWMDSASRRSRWVNFLRAGACCITFSLFGQGL